MPGTVVGAALSTGYPGNAARGSSVEIASRPVVAYYYPINFGDAVMLNTNTPNMAPNTYASLAEWLLWIPGGGMNVNNFAGFAYREVKQYETYISAATAAQQVGPTLANYSNGTMGDVVKRGIVSLLCHVGTPLANGAVYLRFALNAAVPAGIVGGVEAQADGANTVQLVNCRFYDGLVDPVTGCAAVEILYPLCS
jgi:hypothetical protein